MDESSLYELFTKNRPHVVILGAGASCAVLRSGDKNGKKIPAMDGFIDIAGLNSIINKVELNTKSNNLEDIYMELYERSYDDVAYNQVRIDLERAIKKYMSSFVLPDCPSVYDYLVLSLTGKDLIATFNWDPLLVQAVCRVQLLTNNTPNLVFLHGNVGVGYCPKGHAFGALGLKCWCGSVFTPMQLLFPIKKKNYSTDPAINSSWKVLKYYLTKAYMVTIFGYSAPKSDVEAIDMLKQGWGVVEERNMEEMEFIDLKDEDSIYETWKSFIHSHHYTCTDNFFNSSLGKYPRRTCEATFDRLMNCKWLKGNLGFKENMDFSEIKKKIRPLLEDENSKQGERVCLTDPYF